MEEKFTLGYTYDKKHRQWKTEKGELLIREYPFESPNNYWIISLRHGSEGMIVSEKSSLEEAMEWVLKKERRENEEEKEPKDGK